MQKKSPKPAVRAPRPVIFPQHGKPGSRPELIDEFGRLSVDLNQYGAKLRRHEQLRQMILSNYENKDPIRPYDEDGDDWSVHISAKASERKIKDMAKIARRIGIEKFLTLCSLTLETLDGFIPPAHQTADLVVKSQSGPRTVKAVQKFPGQ